MNNKKNFKANWNNFRKEVIELDNYTCVNCNRTHLDGIILQVHHKKYLPNKLPWDYSYDDCETLCKGCHAELHGKIPPKSGWTFHDYDDFEEISEQCEYCGTDIRYVFYISHPHWEPLAVGTVCCDDLTSTNEARVIKKRLESYCRRQKSFISSPRWHNNEKAYYIYHKNYLIRIKLNNEVYQIIVNSKYGKQRFKTLEEAKVKIFSLLEDGSLEKCFNGERKRA